MVNSTMIGTRIFYVCMGCGLSYKDKQIAEDCEKWCLAHPMNKPNQEIMARAMKH